ncbi:hypothetical protein GR212_15245 [Rhizobium lusitanum]|uniref:Uncharacterized protein n=1 Tax=Rhizobium lusitanum TaxID=293958 RepID=A0A6L9U8U7_9HYPH|nr:hypothetical protein [Rhizobium lusitanum]NEI70938.1 hypothetical protein [Rhizobium lusitanum]
MAINEYLDALGIKVGVVVAGFMGGVLRGLSRRRYTAREIFVTPIVGAIAAAYMTEPVLFYLRAINWPLPDRDITATNVSAFIVGIGGMWVSDLVFEIVSRWVRGGKPGP